MQSLKPETDVLWNPSLASLIKGCNKLPYGVGVNVSAALG